MRVLVTGAFGNVGQSTLLALRDRGHQVRASDLATPANRRAATRYPEVEVAWADLRQPEQAASVTHDVDAVLHLAGIIPPTSERHPELTRAVNVEATRNLVTALREANPRALIVLASSVSVFGPQAGNLQPARASDPVQASDHYSRSKLAAEAIVRESGLKFSILRLNAAMPLRLDQFDPIAFDISLQSRLEFVHTRDVGLAFANSLEAPAATGKVLLIAGGESCRTIYRHFFRQMLDSLGVGMLPDEAFGQQAFYTGWMDTAESQAILQYQTRKLDDYVVELKRMMGWRLGAARLARPAVRAWMLAQSPQWRAAHPPVERPDGLWWALVMSGMALTTLLALWPAAHALVLGAAATVLTLPVVRWIFCVAVLLHVGEAVAASVLAWYSHERARSLGWSLQTLLLGYPSLRLLLRRLTPRTAV